MTHLITEENPYGPNTPDVKTNKERDYLIGDIFQTYGKPKVRDGELSWIVRDKNVK